LSFDCISLLLDAQRFPLSILAANCETDLVNKVWNDPHLAWCLLLQSSPAVFSPITTPSADYWRGFHP